MVQQLSTTKKPPKNMRYYMRFLQTNYKEANIVMKKTHVITHVFGRLFCIT